MSKDFIKVKSAIGAENCLNIDCVGIFKSASFDESHLLKIKEEFKRHKYLSYKLNGLKTVPIENTDYTLVYF